ncbi:MAG: hypothetical protein LUB61_02235, partial [Eggerthellaceae bacterium]|nr:hypothetical protein [Eggerthellaceae bacterium]
MDSAVIDAKARNGSKRTLLPAAYVVAILISVLLLLGISAGKAHAADTSWYTGNENESSYTITDANQLAGLAELVNNGTTDFSGKTISLGSVPGTGVTLRLSGEWTPIGTETNPFNGTFSGNSSTITGLSITTGTQNLGLFGYAGSSSYISDLTISGDISLNVTSSSAGMVKNVGALVGFSEGSISNITSSADVYVYSAVPATEEEPVTVEYIGGIGGWVQGSVTSCTVTQYGETYVEAATGSATTDLVWVAGYVGGITGSQGPDPTDLEDLVNHGQITGCTNSSNVTLSTYVAGPNDRFGNPTYTTALFLGGISGYSVGDISNCTNSGNVDSSYRDEYGEILTDYGTRGVGGIVGGYRVAETVQNPTDSTDPGYEYNLSTGKTIEIYLSQCSNSGEIIGLGHAGGLVGNSGTYTTIIGSYNTGHVEATRSTKPSPGGIAGRSYGTICYCYNSGEVVTTTGGGYYAAGIVGMLHSMGMDYDGNTIIPEMYACYNTGYIISSSAIYRAGGLVGELDGGYIHDAFPLSDRTYRNDVSGLDNPTGTIASTAEVISERSALAASSIALLNSCCDIDGWEYYFALPEGYSYNQVVNENSTILGPSIVQAPYSTASDLSDQTGATVTATANAQYSSAIDPVPTLSVVLSDGTTLTQNADFRVIAQENTAGVSVSDATYTAHIEGIGIYKNILPEEATYSIEAGSIAECTITTVNKYFNWEKQKPDTVIVYDSAGNVVDESQYTWSVDETQWNNTTSSPVPYQDAQTSSTSTGYPITITATDSGNYVGSQTANVFKIIQVPFIDSAATDNPNQDTLTFGDITYGDQTWTYEEAEESQGAVKIKYTGSEILPEITSVTYMGIALTEIKDGDAWYNNTYSWGYKVLYGNPNPEGNSVESDTADTINVTGSDYACMTIRSAPLSNFSNYVNIWYEITPADI